MLNLPRFFSQEAAEVPVGKVAFFFSTFTDNDLDTCSPTNSYSEVTIEPIEHWPLLYVNGRDLQGRLSMAADAFSPKTLVTTKVSSLGLKLVDTNLDMLVVPQLLLSDKSRLLSAVCVGK